jgi:D-lactate dehydrogenase
MAERAAIACYEVEPWEEEALRQGLPDLDVRGERRPLGLDTRDSARGASLVSVFIHSRLTPELLGALPDLRFVATRSTGYDHIDLETCRQRGIAVSNVPTYGENTVAEHTFGLILALSRKIHQAYVRTVRGDFSLEGLRGFDLKGRTLGVVGTGNIGLHVIRIGRGFGMRVLAYDLHRQPLLAEVLGFDYVSLDELIAAADIVTLHVPYLPATHHLIDRARLARMKRGSLLINTARGGVVDTEDLLWALDGGILGGAGLDVVEGEDLIVEERQLLGAEASPESLQAAIRGHLLLRHENVVFTPHIGFDSEEALRRILDTTIANVQAFRAGQPVNTVA